MRLVTCRRNGLSGAATRPVPAPSVEPPPVEPPLAIEPPPPIEPPLRPVEVATRPVVPPLGPIEPPKRATAAPPGPATQPAAPRSIAPPLGGAAPGLRPIPPLRRSIPKIGDAAGAGSASPLDAVIAAIAEAANADAANDAAMQYVAGQFRHAVLFAIKDGLAFGDCGHGGQLTAEVIQSITIPLSTPSIVQAAHDTRRLATLASGAAASQDSLARTLGIVAALPVEVGDRVGYVVALGERTAAAGGRSGDLEPLAAALTAAHQRLLQR